MKKIIKWLANISGVTTEIEIRQTKYIGHQMKDYSYWLSQYPDAYNSLGIYADLLKRGLPYPYGGMAERVREKYVENKGKRYDTVNQLKDK